MDKIIAKLKELSELPEPIKTPLGYELLSNERFVSKIIKAELKGYYSGITQRIFLQPEVLNTVFRTFDYDVFINDNRISTELRRLYDLIEFTSAEDFKKQFVRLNHKFNI